MVDFTIKRLTIKNGGSIWFMVYRISYNNVKHAYCNHSEMRIGQYMGQYHVKFPSKMKSLLNVLDLFMLNTRGTGLINHGNGKSLCS